MFIAGCLSTSGALSQTNEDIVSVQMAHRLIFLCTVLGSMVKAAEALIEQWPPKT